MSSAWSRAGLLVAVVFSLAFVPAADAAPLRLDAGFGDGGIARVPFRLSQTGVELRMLRPARQPDGKVLVAASAYFDHGNSQILIARFTRRGRPDPSFGHRGWTHLGLRWNFAPSAVQVLPDGRILVLGAAGYGPYMYPSPGQLGLARLLPDGSRDRSFGTNGFVAWNPPWRADAIFMDMHPGVFVRQGDGRLLAAGEAEELRAGPPRAIVRRVVFVRFNPDGSVDTSFGPAGVVEGPEGPDYYGPWAALPNGRIVVLGSRNEGFDTPAWWLHRFTADGALDRDFGQDGAARLGRNVLDGVNQLLPTRDGSLLMLGTVDPAHPAGSAAAVRRITPAGRLDARFGTACNRSGPRTADWSGAATSVGRLFATAREFGSDSFVLRYGPDGCVAGRTLRIRAVSVGPPLLHGAHTALVAATPNGRNTLALIRVRR